MNTSTRMLSSVSDLQFQTREAVKQLFPHTTLEAIHVHQLSDTRFILVVDNMGHTTFYHFDNAYQIIDEDGGVFETANARVATSKLLTICALSGDEI